MDGLKDKVKIIVQRCLWHIPYQAKYALWQDKVKRKSSEWLFVIAEVVEICSIRPLVNDKETTAAMAASKKARLKKVLKHCKGQGYTHTA